MENDGNRWWIGNADTDHPPPRLPPHPDALIDTADLPPEALAELAESYVDLIRMMSTALYQCSTGHAFFWWNGRGFEITGHPPQAVVDQIVEAQGPSE